MKKSKLKKQIKEILLNEINGEDYELEDRKMKYGIHPEEDEFDEDDDIPYPGGLTQDDYDEDFEDGEENDFYNGDEEFSDEDFDDDQYNKEIYEKKDKSKPKDDKDEEEDDSNDEENDSDFDSFKSEDQDMDEGDDTEKLQKNLEDALELAKNMGDEKLADQIGNTITFFTRSHIVGRGRNKEEGEGEEMENEFPPEEEEGENLNEVKERFQRLAGIKK